MSYEPVTSGATTNPWANSQFYIDNQSGALSANNNPFGGTNVLWVMDPESRRETRRSFGSNVTGYQKAYAAELARGGVSGIAQTTASTTGSGGPSTTRQTQRQFKKFTLQEVEGLATSAFQAAIGRAASSEELKTFLSHLNSAEKKNPTVSKSVTHSSGTKNAKVTTTGTSSGGLDEQQFATDFAQQNPEYAGYQKATTYFDAMLGALQGPVGGGF